MSKEDRLDSITGDLVGQARWQPALRELFKRPAGKWCSATELSAQLSEAYGTAASDVLDDLRIAWLPDPYCETNSDYAVVLFFVSAGDVLWERAAWFNRASLQVAPSNSTAISN
jgi:hypothetical protein